MGGCKNEKTKERQRTRMQNGGTAATSREHHGHLHILGRGARGSGIADQAFFWTLCSARFQRAPQSKFFGQGGLTARAHNLFFFSCIQHFGLFIHHCLPQEDSCHSCFSALWKYLIYPASEERVRFWIKENRWTKEICCSKQRVDTITTHTQHTQLFTLLSQPGACPFGHRPHTQNRATGPVRLRCPTALDSVSLHESVPICRSSPSDDSASLPPLHSSQPHIANTEKGTHQNNTKKPPCTKISLTQRSLE